MRDKPINVFVTKMYKTTYVRTLTKEEFDNLKPLRRRGATFAQKQSNVNRINDMRRGMSY